MQTLKAHLAAAAPDISGPNSDVCNQRGVVTKPGISEGKSHTTNAIFKEIVELQVGEALLFSPSAMVEASGTRSDYTRLGGKRLKVRVRARLTTDGGKSVLAT